MRPFRTFHLMGIVLVSLPTWLSAKAPTVRVTVTGGRLAYSIQITNVETLNLSNAWGEGFLDISKPPLKEPPKASSAYEVTFYSGADNDIRKTCVFYYSPAWSAEQGLIYLPGIDTALNAGTIIRQGRDGKWSYASAAWDALIKPFIARGEAERDVRSASIANTGPGGHQTWNSSTVSEVAVEKWTRPRSGWLYVLDPRFGPYSRVWLLDPETSKVMGSIRAGYDPDFALSPDGSYL